MGNGEVEGLLIRTSGLEFENIYNITKSLAEKRNELKKAKEAAQQGGGINGMFCRKYAYTQRKVKQIYFIHNL